MNVMSQFYLWSLPTVSYIRKLIFCIVKYTIMCTPNCIHLLSAETVRLVIEWSFRLKVRIRVRLTKLVA